MDKAIIPPGDSAALEIVFNTSTYSGLITKRPAIYIDSNTAVPPLRVEITAEITIHPDSLSPLVITPPKFELIADGSSDTLSFEITNRSGDIVGLQLLDIASDLMDISLPGTVGAHQTAPGKIILKPAAADAEFRKSITIGINDPMPARYTIPIRQIRLQR